MCMQVTWLAEMTNAAEAIKKREYLYTAGGNTKWYSHLEKNMEVYESKKCTNHMT